MKMDDFLKMMVPDEDDCITQVPNISTLVFMDLEATGLPSFVGKKNVHITEMSLVAIDRTNFESDDTLRVLNKLSLCIRPRASVSPGAMAITGLYNDVLESQEKFDSTIPKLLEYFFRRLRRPVCLLAHNGKKYDFPLLQAELRNINYTLDPEILCADTLEAFRCIANNPVINVEPVANLQVEVMKLTNGTTLEDETEKLLSEDMELFLEIEEPTEQPSTEQNTEKLLSDDMELFVEIEEPTKQTTIEHSTYSKDKTFCKFGNNSSNFILNSKINTKIDEKTPPKYVCTELAPENVRKKFKPDPDFSPENPHITSSLTQTQSQAKRKLFPTHQTLNNFQSTSHQTPNNFQSTSHQAPNNFQSTSHQSPHNSKPVPSSKVVQFALDKLYCHYFGENPPKSHYAEADCITLSKICQKVNKDFLQWIDEHSKSFSDTDAMW